jgi:hypothetical protein
MMRKPTRVRLTSDATLLLLSGVGLLLGHGFAHHAEASRTIPFIIELRERALLQWRRSNTPTAPAPASALHHGCDCRLPLRRARLSW